MTADSEDAYVRMLATITYDEDADTVFDKYSTNELFAPWLDINAAWKVVGTKPVTTKTTDAATGKVTVSRTYEFRYYDAANETDIVTRSDTATELPPLFTTLTIPGGLTNAEIATLEGMEITVVAHAIQSSGFADADAAWTAFDTQNS